MAEWSRWQHLAEPFSQPIKVGSGTTATIVAWTSRVYGVTAHFEITEEPTFAGARAAILRESVERLARLDAHFPFARATGWSTSADKLATPGEWSRQSAYQVLSSLSAPLILEAPVLIALSSRAIPFAGGTPDQRRL